MEGEREAIENEKDDLERQFEALKLMVEPYRYYLKSILDVHKLRILQHNNLIQGPTWELRDGAPRPSRPKRGGGGWSEETGCAEWSSSWPPGLWKSMSRYSVNICPPCQNHSQKIQHVVKIKQENVQLKTEVVYWIVWEGLLNPDTKLMPSLRWPGWRRNCSKVKGNWERRKIGKFSSKFMRLFWVSTSHDFFSGWQRLKGLRDLIPECPFNQRLTKRTQW